MSVSQFRRKIVQHSRLLLISKSCNNQTMLYENQELPVRPSSCWWKCLGSTSSEWPATTGNGFLPLTFDLISPAKRRNPLGSDFLGAYHRHHARVLQQTHDACGATWNGLAWWPAPWPRMRERERTQNDHVALVCKSQSDNSCTYVDRGLLYPVYM